MGINKEVVDFTRYRKAKYRMTMYPFTKFKQYYRPDVFSKFLSTDWSAKDVEKFVGGQVTGFTDFLRVIDHSSYEEGLIRFLVPQSPLPLSLYEWNSDNGWVSHWPEYKEQLIVFAYDWLGRQFAFDRNRAEEGELMISLLEPGAGELLEAPVTFLEFIEEALIEDPSILANTFHQEWRTNGGDAPELDQCVGYKTPLFLGGTDTVDNLEMIDMDVYVVLCGQLFEGSLSLSIGESISEIKVDGD